MSPTRVLRSERLTGWHVAAAIVLASIGVLATIDAWTDIFRYAYVDEEYSHIFIVPVVAVWMLWVRRMRFRHCKISGTIFGPLLAAVGWLGTTYGLHHQHQALWHGGALLVVIGCMISVLGKNVMLRFFPAFVVLIFLIPVPGLIRQAIALPLQTWTANIAQACLETMNVDTEVSGNQLSINGQTVTIADACNGMRDGIPADPCEFRLQLRTAAAAERPTDGAGIQPDRGHRVQRHPHRAYDLALRKSAARYRRHVPHLQRLDHAADRVFVTAGHHPDLAWAMLPVTRYPLASQYA